MTDVGHGYGQKDNSLEKICTVQSFLIYCSWLCLFINCISAEVVLLEKKAEVLLPDIELEAGHDETSQTQEAVWDIKANSAMHTTLHISVSSILKHLILLFGYYIWGTVCGGIPAECQKLEKTHLLQKLPFQIESKGKKATKACL